MNEQNKLKILLLTSGSSAYCGSHHRLEEMLDGYFGVSWRSNTYKYVIVSFMLTLLHPSLLKLITCIASPGAFKITSKWMTCALARHVKAVKD